jgi:hypothetical protein
MAEPPPKGRLGVVKATPMALGGGSLPPRAMGWLRPPQTGQSGVAWLNRGGRQPPMGWVATPLLFYLILLFYYLILIFLFLF